MKRILSFVICFVMVMSMSICVSAKDFSDLSADHWAYANIQTLISEGTINGYEDGTFKPSKEVTRAEFVKMLGKWDQKSNKEYSDLPDSHWAYEYIIWSGLDSVGSSIQPDTPIKRSDVINLIWKRNGSPKHNLAPRAIILQGTNADATSWAYTIGLMKGDDGVNLRLNSSLTRAEAATLIVRSRDVVKANVKNNFIDLTNEEVLKRTYETLNLLGDKYDADRVLTYGEVARMAIVFGADGGAINFVGNDLLDENNKLGKLFEHKYSNEMFILSTKVWGSKHYTIKKIDEPASVQDTVSAIMYGYTRRGTTPQTLGKQYNYYPDCIEANSTVWENMYLSFANTQGIKLDVSGKIGSKEPTTAKKFAALMVQFNEVLGLGVSYANGVKNNVKMNISSATLPANYTDFKLTIDGAPVELYNLKKDGVIASKSYNSINQLAFVYDTYLQEVKNNAKEMTGYVLDATFYPALSYKQDGKVTFVAKFHVKPKTADSSNVSIDSLFSKIMKTPTGKTIKPNSEFYVAFETYQPLMDIYLPYSGAYVKAVFINE